MFSQTVEYALRAMAFLGARGAAPATSEVIAKGTQVPPGYLSKVLRDLVVADLITSQRGPNGGFAITKPLQSITVLEIVNAVDPIQRITKCPLGNPAHVNLCPLHARLDNAIASIEAELRRTTLGEIIDDGKAANCQALSRAMGATINGAPALSPGATATGGGKGQTSSLMP